MLALQPLASTRSVRCVLHGSVVLCALLAPGVSWAGKPSWAPRAAAVASEHPAAAHAGAAILAAGGSAVDAAIAAAATVCVIHPSSCGIGGGGFALVRPAAGPAVVLDFRETAPARATADRFLGPDGRPAPERLRQGGLAVATPGEVAGWVALQRRFGRLPLARVLAPAVRLARDGFLLAESPLLQRQIAAYEAMLRNDPGLAATFLEGGSRRPGPEFRVVQTDLASTLETIGVHGLSAVREGPIAEAIVRAVQARGGLLEPADLAHYRPRWRRPLVGRFRGRHVLTVPPPGGGALVLTALGMLARDDPAALGAGSATWLHLLAGVMAQAFADRAAWYGDPIAMAVPVDALLAPPRLSRLRARLRATARIEPETAAGSGGSQGTAHVSVLDSTGMAVALTTTINGPFGAGILVPGTGIVLNNEMDDFALAPGLANLYGLTGTAANTVAPHKRPQSSMSPTIVVHDGLPELVLGGSGGPTIVSGVLQVLIGVVAFGQDAPAAVAAPRIHDQGIPPALAVEPGIEPGVRAMLRRLGHRLRDVPAAGAVAAVAVAPDGSVSAAGDPRKDGGAIMIPVARAQKRSPKRIVCSRLAPTETRATGASTSWPRRSM